MHGFFQKIVAIDLSEETYQVETPDAELYQTYLGGKGLSSWLLHKLNPKGVDPLSGDNHLIFSTGAGTGTATWGGSRYGVFTKSPLTGFYVESYSGGKIPEAISATGFDAIIFKGKAKRLTVIEITPDGVLFHDASDISGMNTFDTEKTVRDRFHKRENRGWKSGSAVIGPAAENGVSFSIIKNDGWRCAGRAGTGTVMGSKRIKAIVFQGDRKRSVHDPKKLKAIFSKLSKESKDNPIVKAYKSMGTSMNVKNMNNAGAFPTKYWSRGTCDHWEKISADALHTQCDVTPHACAKCFLSCGRMTTVLSGRHKGLTLEGPEYETIYVFGGLCMVDSIEEVIHLNHLCDGLGMDTITTGNLCAFAMEAYSRGHSDYAIEYGDAEATAELIRKIAKKEADVGEILAKGIKHAAKVWSMEDVAIHVKGLEPAGYDPRVLKGMGLGYATSDRGACHLRTTFYKPELSGMIPPDQIEGKAEMLIDFEDRLTIFDTFVLCRFYRDMYDWNLLGDLLHAITGLDGTPEALKKIAGNIAQKTRDYNIQEGLSKEDERLPKGFYKKLEDSQAEITQEEMNQLLSDYYELRGWSQPKSALNN